MSPVLVATELGMAALALKEGWLRDKLAGWGGSFGMPGSSGAAGKRPRGFGAFAIASSPVT